MAARLLGLPQAEAAGRAPGRGDAGVDAMASLEGRAAGASMGRAAPTASDDSAPAGASGAAAAPPLGDFAGLRATTSAGEPAFRRSAGAAAAAAPLDLMAFESEAALCSADLDVLKAELQRRGMKCGGTPEERAARLWKARGVPHWRLSTLDPSLFARPSSGKKRERAAPEGSSRGFVREAGPLLPGEYRRPGQKKIRSSTTVARAQQRQHGTGSGLDEHGMPLDSILRPENRGGEV